MKIKKYTVNRMQEALQLIKQDLGPEAVIVSSYKINGPGWLGWLRKKLEVTAVLDDTPVPEPPSLPPAEAAVQVKVQPDPLSQPPQPNLPPANMLGHQTVRSRQAVAFNGAVERVQLPETRFQPLLDEALLQLAESDLETKVKGMELRSKNNMYRRWLDKLRQMDVQENIARVLLEAALREVREQATDDMIELLLINKTAEVLKSAYREAADARFMTFVGQPGVGKTTTLAKLATRLKLLHKKKIALLTVYTYRYGCQDPLKVYGDTLDVPVEVVMTPAELRQAIDSHADKDHLLIDTVGRSAKNTGQVLELKGFLEVIPGPHDIFLVLNASTKDRDLFRTIKEFRLAHFNKFIFTRLDETETLGSLLNVVSRTGLPIAYYSDGQNIPDDLARAHPKKLANLLFRSADAYAEPQL
ncbi:flagellar biosynthesis protein FlhF [Desulforamulus hydrothermalis]|uniref:Flagellar biosynthesis protein FlhF n=1 Tax=Desulforamulus hydrothermalis Lam5 = DSM 18033 TaxID=1121428 RepID=K8EKW7_9FIRM|nr:flagellar biosynthesis protein FlhF [Desulforamulus hydrothermalis]CCO09181.1 flagellar biosynthesis regulator FlhF [Desulforamulus hydrothermalis Lam5 = DSM 18033]SHH11154.1 flagellar biosynthesis protein FlhF [Desulforamulus hydrothermalis Lam5 = DSM 18033]